MNTKLKLAIGLFGTLGTFISQSAFATCTENTASISSSLIDSGGATCISNTSPGSITTTGNFVEGIYTSNPLISISNSGSITTSGDEANGISIFRQVDLLSNTGSITTLGLGASGIYINNASTIQTFNNGGTIYSSDRAGIYNFGTIQSLSNSLAGVISSSVAGFSAINQSSGHMGSIVNQGLIDGGLGIGISNSSGTIDTINNTSTGSIVGYIGISNFGTINNIINSGVVSNSLGSSGSINNHGVIGTITNTGVLNDPNNRGISNSYSLAFPTTSINTLNNSQGAGNINGALRYYGMLPTSYNIIINSTSNYGQLSLIVADAGSTTFGISSLSGTNIGIAGTRYQNVLSGVNASYISNENTTLTYVNGSFTAKYQLVADDGNASNTWDLLILSILTATDTQSSIHSLASKLRGAFSSQAVATNYANMNTYDCNLFDTRGLCISVGGQQTYVDSPSSNLTSTVVVAGYKVSPTFRIGGFLNQNYSTSRSVDISNANPLMGLFAVWNQNEDHLGYQVKIANAYQDKDVTTIREINGTSEAGRGNTELNTQSYLGELSYAFLANDEKTLVRPYAAVRYTRIKQDAYSEEATSAVTAPLTYSALSDRSTSALVGVKVDHKLAEKLNLKASLGVEQDLYHHVDNLTATGISGLTSENFNDNIKRTRPVASIGAYYMPAKNQRISADLYYQQLPFQSTGSATAYVNYMIGF